MSFHFATNFPPQKSELGEKQLQCMVSENGTKPEKIFQLWFEIKNCKMVK